MAKLDMMAIREEFHRRPWWIYPLLGFCVYMTFIYLPYDLFVKPIEQDVEVWLGFKFTGWWAKLTAPIHWAIYAIGSWGLWRMKAWMHPWAAVYVLYIGLTMWLFSFMHSDSMVVGLLPLVVCIAGAYGLWRQRTVFGKLDKESEVLPT